MHNILTKTKDVVIINANRYADKGIPTDGLIGEYLFNNDVLDTSGNGYNGVASAITFVNDRKSQENKAASFNGSSSQIQIPNNPFYFSNNQPFSVSHWYNFNSAQSGNDYWMFSGRNVVGGINWLIGYKSAGDSVTIENNDSAGTRAVVIDNSPPSQDIWVHSVTVFTGTRMKTYINNVLINDELMSFGTISSDTDKFFFGRDNFGGNRFLGVLDDIRVYNRELTLQEINSLYNE